MPVFLPIRQRKRRGPTKAEDPILRKISQGVIAIIFGFMAIMVGIMLTVFGANVNNFNNDVYMQKKHKYRLIVGPIVLVVGTLISISGGIVYGINIRKRSTQTTHESLENECKDTWNESCESEEDSDAPKLHKKMKKNNSKTRSNSSSIKSVRKPQTSEESCEQFINADIV